MKITSNEMSYKDFIKSNGYFVKKLVALVVVASILMSAGIAVLAETTHDDNLLAPLNVTQSLQ